MFGRSRQITAPALLNESCEIRSKLNHKISVEQPREPFSQEILIDLLTATGSKDKAAFKSLVDLTSAKLFGICLYMCGSSLGAEDVLIDVYSTVLNRAADWQLSHTRPILWLMMIARERAADWRRSQQKMDCARQSVTPIKPLAGSEAEQRDKVNIIAPVFIDLVTLPPLQRRVIIALFLERLKYSEIAEREQLPMITIKAEIHLGLMLIKAQLFK